MKRLRWSVLLALVATCWSPTPASAVHRTMLLETFTNMSCGPCADNSPAVHEFMNKYGPALAVGIQYHVWWPSNQDPFYLLTQTEVTARKTYYSVSGVPMDFTDAALASLWESELDTLEAHASVRLQTESPFALTVQHSVGGGQVNVTVTVHAVDAPPAGGLTLQVALIETEVHYGTPPGNNGERDFYNSMRRMLPTASGTALFITQGGEQTFNFSTPVVGAWNTANIRAVAWIQHDATKDVLQAGSSIPQPQYASYFGTREPPDIVPLGTMRTFKAVLMNRGTGSDTYDLHIERDLPADWGASVCARGTCYPPATTDFSLLLTPGAVDTVLVDVTPLVSSGTGTMTLTATSRGAPSTSWTRSFKVISSGLSVLLVDMDYGNTFETWYAAALDSAPCTYAIWDRIAHGPLSVAQLENFPVVVWDVDLVSPPMTPGDMDALGTYLDAGGRLFISGQDVGWAMCDPLSPDCTPQSLAWYAKYLGAAYVVDNQGLQSVYGVAGDPIGDGLSFIISGGTGSGWQWNPDEIEALPGASPILYYSVGHEAGVRYQAGAYKVVYLAYGFQAQDTYTSQATLMRRSLQWLGCPGVADVPGHDGTTPLVALAPRATPNPFGPATRISFVVGGGGKVPVSVVVYDVSGRRLRTLWEGPAAPGARSLVWDGRADGGSRAGSGIYLARVCVGKERRTLKLVLTE